MVKKNYPNDLQLSLQVVTVQHMETSTVHATYMSSNLKGAPKPDMGVIIKEIMAENANIGANGAMQRATEVVRAWAVANGYAK